jgi:hypothetical protein
MFKEEWDRRARNSILPRVEVPTFEIASRLHG